MREGFLNKNVKTSYIGHIIFIIKEAIREEIKLEKIICDKPYLIYGSENLILFVRHVRKYFPFKLSNKSGGERIDNVISLSLKIMSIILFNNDKSKKELIDLIRKRFGLSDKYNPLSDKRTYLGRIFNFLKEEEFINIVKFFFI